MARSRLLALGAVLVLFLAGGAAAVLPGEHESTSSACDTATAIASVPPIAYSDGGTRNGEIVGATDTETKQVCVTATATATDSTTTVPGPTTTVTTTVTAAATPSYYVANKFEGDLATAIETAPFYTQYSYPYNNNFDASHFLAVPGAAGQGLGLKIFNSDPYGSTDLGPQTFVGVRPADAHAHQGESTWYRIKFKIPSSGYYLNHGSQQWLVEWHEQTSAGNSIAVGLTSWYYSSGTTPDMNKIQLYFRPGGGNSSSPTYENWTTPLPMIPGTESLFNAAGGLKLDSWYDLVFHIVWDKTASSAGGTGQFDIWLNGMPLPMKQWINSSNGDGPQWSNPHSFPTLYNVNGTPDYTNYGLYMYAKKPPSSSEIDYDDYYIGPTAASVGFTP